MFELLIVLVLAWMIMSLMLPAVVRAREHALFILCKNNMKQIAGGFISFAQTYKQRLPGNTWTINPQTNPVKASWLFHNTATSAPTTGTLFAFLNNRKFYRCPSLPSVPGNTMTSNGYFDYGMYSRLYGARLDRIDSKAHFYEYMQDRETANGGLGLPPLGSGQNFVKPTPIVTEESPIWYINNGNMEADHSNIDRMGNWHRWTNKHLGTGAAANYADVGGGVTFVDVSGWNSGVVARRVTATNPLGFNILLAPSSPRNWSEWDVINSYRYSCNTVQPGTATLQYY